jgi:hypothetical protein
VGSIRLRDSEYRRHGTANLFCALEPATGKFKNRITSRRTAKDYARFLYAVSKRHPTAKKIYLIQDNLNVHCEKSLIDCYGKSTGRRIWRRFRVCYTPKHASWLNQAEIGLSIYSRQCLGKRRISNIEPLACETQAWTRRRNRKPVPIQWKFTTKQARKKFRYSGVLFRRGRH